MSAKSSLLLPVDRLLLMRLQPCSFLPRSAPQEPVVLLLSLRSGCHTGTTVEDNAPLPPHTAAGRRFKLTSCLDDGQASGPVISHHT